MLECMPSSVLQSVRHFAPTVHRPSSRPSAIATMLFDMGSVMARRRAALIIGMSCCYARRGSAFTPSALFSSLARGRARAATCLLVAPNSRTFSDRRSRKKHGPSSTTFEHKGPHPRNVFKGSYDMEKLCQAYPPLQSYVVSPNDNAKANESSKKAPNRPTIKFADPNAVRALNTALLVVDYNIKPNYAEILPRNALVPPVPGRADYIHHLADLLGEQDGNIPEGASVRGLDIGTGASVIYPLVATSTYGWSMVASEINVPSLQSAQRIIEENTLENLIDLRQQESEDNIFDGILQPKEAIDFVMCNPPFFLSLEAFQAENARKIKGLARGGMNKRSRSLSKANEADQKNEASNNFGGTDSELWCEGGEVSFVRKMIDESKSKRYRHKFLWCTSLVSRESNCERIEKYLRNNAQPADVRRISFGAGKKSASILAWTFLNKDKRRDWASKWRS